MQGVLEWRSAQRAVDLFNQGRPGIEALEKEPYLQAMLVEMSQAGGREADWPTLRAEMHAATPPAGDADPTPPTIGRTAAAMPEA